MKAEWTNRDNLSIEETTGHNSKSILMIDTPENCGKCRLVDHGQCRGSKSYIPLSSYNRSKECPLRPLPKKEEKPIKGEDDYNDFCIGYTRGWNECLEDILGETE